MTPLPKVDTHLPGAGCLLCLAAASMANIRSQAATYEFRCLRFEDSQLSNRSSEIPEVNRLLGDLIVTSFSLALVLCASTHDMASSPNQLGGGIREFDVADGIYRVMVKTNVAPWENLPGARSSWQSRAETLCGSAGFKEFKIHEYSFNHVPPIGFVRYIVTAREGYAVCNRIKISNEAALATIRKSRE